MTQQSISRYGFFSRNWRSSAFDASRPQVLFEAKEACAEGDEIDG
jgi:hypothetical protein